METIQVDGSPRRCLVVRCNDEDRKKRHPDTPHEVTIWIDEEQKTIVKTLRRGPTYGIIPGSEARIPFFEQTSTVYRVVAR